MSDPTPTTTPNQTDEVSLQDIDRILESEDPEFTKSLDEVRAVAPDPSVNIESSGIDDADSLSGDDKIPDKPPGFFGRIRNRMRLAWMGFANRIRARLVHAGKELIIFLKTRPKEFIFFAFSMIKVLIKKSVLPIKAFKEANAAQRMAILLLLLLSAAVVWVSIHNLKGIWLPSINEPILNSFEPFADYVEEYDVADPGESFYSAFPQERHEFLFRKMKVNLRSTPDSPLPMGAFEIIVDLDSSDTSVEIRDREVEFRDLLQRSLEEETFNDLETELGKTKLKSRIKRELNQKLTQGWVRDVSFKTFVLKP